MIRLRETNVPRDRWPARVRAAEWVYRKLHGGQIRTLVIREPLVKPDPMARYGHRPKHRKVSNAPDV